MEKERHSLLFQFQKQRRTMTIVRVLKERERPSLSLFTMYALMEWGTDKKLKMLLYLSKPNKIEVTSLPYRRSW